jgi:uncharacterized protein YgiM (DUF1202 family)
MMIRAPVVRFLTALVVGAALLATMLLSATAVGAEGADHGRKANRAAETDQSAAEAVGGQGVVDLVEGMAAVINDEPVNLRADATLEAEIMTELSTGTEVTILDGPVSADGYDWFQVETDGGTGWVAGPYLTVA